MPATSSMEVVLDGIGGVGVQDGQDALARGDREKVEAEVRLLAENGGESVRHLAARPQGDHGIGGSHHGGKGGGVGKRHISHFRRSGHATHASSCSLTPFSVNRAARSQNGSVASSTAEAHCASFSNMRSRRIDWFSRSANVAAHGGPGIRLWPPPRAR